MMLPRSPVKDGPPRPPLPTLGERLRQALDSPQPPTEEQLLLRDSLRKAFSEMPPVRSVPRRLDINADEVIQKAAARARLIAKALAWQAAQRERA